MNEMTQKKDLLILLNETQRSESVRLSKLLITSLNSSFSNQESANLHFPISASVSRHVEGVTSPNKLRDITHTCPEMISQTEPLFLIVMGRKINISMHTFWSQTLWTKLEQNVIPHKIVIMNF